jgi:hypothetical protein
MEDEAFYNNSNTKNTLNMFQTVKFYNDYPTA